MKIYGWDWYTFQAQPSWIIELAKKKLGMEAKLAEKAEQEAKVQNNNNGQ